VLALNPYDSNWTIKVKVLRKMAVRTIKTGRVMNAELVDEEVGGRPGCCACNEHVVSGTCGTMVCGEHWRSWWTRMYGLAGRTMLHHTAILCTTPAHPTLPLTTPQGTVIQITFWREAVERYADTLTEGRVYLIGKASVRVANKQYNSTGHDYEVHIDGRGEIEEAADQNIGDKMKVCGLWVWVRDNLDGWIVRCWVSCSWKVGPGCGATACLC
jgi:hypothetical protein